MLRGLAFKPGRRLNRNPDPARQRLTIGSNVRKVVVPVAIVALALGAWLITKDPAHGPVQGSVAVAPVVPTPGGSTIAIEIARAVVAPDEPVANEPPVMLPHQVPATPITQALEDFQMPPMPELLEAERVFAGERVDPAWANAMEGHILGEIARTPALQLVTLQVECRTSMCRVQLVQQQSQGAEPGIVFPSVRPDPRTGSGRAASFGTFVSTLGLDPRWVASVVDRNGTPTSLAYLARREPAP